MVASTDVYGAIVAAVGGDDVDVTSIIDSPSKDPHEYSSTPRDAAAVAACDLAVGNGGGYDDFFFTLVDSAGTGVPVLDVARLSGLQQHVPAGEEFNEHLWFSLPTMHKLADQLVSQLSVLRPEARARFTAHAATFHAEVDALQRQVADLGSKHPSARVAATEPLPLYLLAAADLVNVTPVEFMAASESGNDAPAAVVQKTLQLIAGPQPVRALLVNTETQIASTERLRRAAKKAGVPEVAISETLSDGQRQYPAWVASQLAALAAALDS